MAQLEIACFNVTSAIIAAQNGADRIELCAGMEVGGTTPDLKTVELVREKTDISLYAMIRPSGGSFVYTDSEFNQMKSDILALKKQKVDGFVFGILNEDNTINFPLNKELVELAHPFPCTFHRAFDQAADAHQSLEQIIKCGFSTILTSGQKPNVVEGIDRLTDLVKSARNRIIIMPGGGLRSTNINQISKQTQAFFYHSSAITDDGTIASADEIKALKSALK